MKCHCGSFLCRFIYFFYFFLFTFFNFLHNFINFTILWQNKIVKKIFTLLFLLLVLGKLNRIEKIKYLWGERVLPTKNVLCRFIGTVLICICVFIHSL